MHLPSYDQIRDIHTKYAPDESTFTLVFTHCQIVWEIAKQLIEANNIAIDVSFVHVGCLLHDIGAYRLKVKNEPFGGRDYIRHGLVGYDILKTEGFDEAICRIAERHTGVGITIEEI